MLPHQNLPMYMDTLKLYMKERADDALHDYVDVEQELPQMYGQETLPVEREITPVKDANIEIALGRMATPRQLGETQDEYHQQVKAAQRMESVDYYGPQIVEASMTRDTQSMPAGSLQPAFEKEESREPSIHAGIALPKGHIIQRQTSLQDRAAYQKMRNSDLFNKGHSHIADQGVAFSTHRAIDLDRVVVLLQPLMREVPEPNDDGDEDEDETDRQSRRSLNNRQPSSLPLTSRSSGGGTLPPRQLPQPQPGRGNGSGHAPQRQTIPTGIPRVPVMNRANAIPEPAYHFLGSQGIAAALNFHREGKVERLKNLIHKHLSVRIVLPKGAKMNWSDGSSVSKYKGSQRFKDLEDWLALLVIHLERTQYGGTNRDRERVLVVADFLRGQALSWYTDHVILATVNEESWTFEEVVIGLYDRFVHPSAMEDARMEMEQVEYDPTKGVQGVYDEMRAHARNMAEPPDNHTLVKSFLAALPGAWRKELFHQGLSPVMNQIPEFVGAAKALEMTERTAQLYEQYVGHCPTRNLDCEDHGSGDESAAETAATTSTGVAENIATQDRHEVCRENGGAILTAFPIEQTRRGL